jgi:hypothetical protein
MKTIELSEATAPLASYVEQAAEDPLLITVDGRLKAAIMVVDDEDEETVGLSTNRRFLEMLEESRKGYRDHGGIPSDEIRRRYGIPIGAEVPPVSCDDYRQVLDRLGPTISETQRTMLIAHYRAPDRTASANELARAAGFSGHQATNANYGRLGRLVGEWMSYPFETEYWIESLATWTRQGDGELRLTMRPELAQALEKLGWV